MLPATGEARSVTRHDSASRWCEWIPVWLRRPGAAPRAKSTWKLVWQDALSGIRVDPAEWEFEVNADGGGKHALQLSLERQATVAVEPLSLNLAVGGNPPAAPDAATVFPQRFEIDHVGVSQRSAPDWPHDK